MKLSENFSLHEFTRSQTAIRNNIDNTPTDKQILIKKFMCTRFTTCKRLLYETYDY